MAKSNSVSFGGKSFKVSKSKLAAVPSQLNGNALGGTNTHPWANPLETLYGTTICPDLLDFFKDTSKKKSVHQRALRLAEVIDLIQDSWDPVSQTINVSAWKHILGETREVEGSAFSCSELEDIAFATRKHYALVSVASGFDWSARGINLYPLMKDLDILEALPEGCAEMWHITVLICLWVVYEGLGLGGLNEEVLAWHGWMRAFGRSGKIKEEQLNEEQLIEYKLCPSPEAFLRKYWVKFLSEEGIKDELIQSDPIWQNILFLATGREIVAKKAKGDPLNEYQKKYTFGGLEPDEVEFLVLCAAAQRAAAKGKLSLNDGDDFDNPAGIVAALNAQGHAQYWDMLMSVKYPSVGTQMLLDVFVIVEDWSGVRSAIIGQENSF